MVPTSQNHSEELISKTEWTGGPIFKKCRAILGNTSSIWPGHPWPSRGIEGWPSEGEGRELKAVPAGPGATASALGLPWCLCCQPRLLICSLVAPIIQRGSCLSVKGQGSEARPNMDTVIPLVPRGIRWPTDNLRFL